MSFCMCSITLVVICSIEMLSGCTLSPNMIGGMLLMMGSYVNVSFRAESILLLMYLAILLKFSSVMPVINFSLCIMGTR